MDLFQRMYITNQDTMLWTHAMGCSIGSIPLGQRGISASVLSSVTQHREEFGYQTLGVPILIKKENINNDVITATDIL